MIMRKVRRTGKGRTIVDRCRLDTARRILSAPASRRMPLHPRLGSRGQRCARFLFDITFYGNTIFQPTVLHIIFKSGSGQGPVVDGGSLATNLCWQMVILALIGLPGYYVAIYFMERMGRKKIQIQGFVVMAVLYAVLAVALEGLEGFPVMLLIVYGLTYFFSNFGPNSTTFILPSETFPPEVRSTLNGVCAATGKAALGLRASGWPISGELHRCCRPRGPARSRGASPEQVGQQRPLRIRTSYMEELPASMQRRPSRSTL